MARRLNHSAFVTSLEAERAARGVSWRRVAQDTDIDISAIHRILKGTVPDVGKYVALADWIGAPVEQFLEGSQPPILVGRSTKSLVIESRIDLPQERWDMFVDLVRQAFALAQVDGHQSFDSPHGG